MNNEYNEICNLNNNYISTAERGMQIGANYKVFIGEMPIILSAPHSVRQIRNGEIKKADYLTGGIVEYLATKYKTYGIIRIFNDNDDPNYDKYSSYRDEIIKMVKNYNIKCLIDIHACKGDESSIEIGTNDGKNVDNKISWDKLIDRMRQIGVKVRIDEKFKAAFENTVSCSIHLQTQIPCIQIELSKALRDSDEQLVPALDIIIDEIEKELEIKKMEVN